MELIRSLRKPKKTSIIKPASLRRADSSAVEHLLYTQGVTGSKPVPPTIMNSRRRGVVGLTRMPVTHEITGSNPVASAIL